MVHDIFSMENKTVFVTGAGRGLGKHFSKTLSSKGAHVILSGRNLNLLKETSQEIQNEGGKCSYFQMDITDFDHLKKNSSQLFDRFGRIDVLVNNAGVSNKIKKQSWEYDFEDWDAIFDTNLKAMWFLSNLFAKKMMEDGIQGNIVNIASTVANRTRPKNPIYGISKSAVESLTKKMAYEYAKYGICINAIAPGFFMTDINRNYLESEQGQEYIKKGVPLSRTGNLDELNGPLLLLSSRASSYMIGECLFVDGGLIVNAME